MLSNRTTSMERVKEKSHDLNSCSQFVTIDFLHVGAMPKVSSFLDFSVKGVNEQKVKSER